MKKLIIICLFLPFISFFSCSARVNGSLAADGSASLSLSMSLGSRVSALIRSMAAVAGQPDGSILDSSSINNSMSKAPGIASVSLKNTSPSALEGTVQISKISDFLSLTGEKSFITFEQNNSGGRCTININRNNSAEIVSLLSSEAEIYLNALMAPAVTGENVSKTEYLELITMFYSKPICDEIAASRFRVSLEFPGNITGVKGGTYSGRKADFDIALVDLLVLETPVNLEVQWR